MKRSSGWSLGCGGLFFIILALGNLAYIGITGRGLIGPRSDAARNAMPWLGSVIVGGLGLAFTIIGAFKLIKRTTTRRDPRWSHPVPHERKGQYK